jgi:iron(III) transport system ATP-binding protein
LAYRKWNFIFAPLQKQPKMVTVALQYVKYAYGRRQVLHGISHVFQPGAFTAVMGQNGSGKTTLLRVSTKWLPISKVASASAGRMCGPCRWKIWPK